MKNCSLKEYDLVDSQTIATQQKHLQQMQNQNLKQNLTSVSKSHWLLSLITVAVAFAVVPLLPILVAFVVGNWIAKQNK